MGDIKFNIPLAKPNITSDDIQSVQEVLLSGMLVQGSKVAEVEKKLGLFLNVPHVKMVSNGTATLHLALLCAGIGPGDEVIVPAFSYVATANVVELVGATPIFVDIDISTFNINPQLIEAKISSKTKAVIPVHEFGLSAEMNAIMKIANQHNLIVIEDAACALGAKAHGKFTGTWGDYGSFSFHPRKAITSGEGGALLAKSVEKDLLIARLRNHGIDMIDGNMEFVNAGFNYRMTDIQAALLSGQVDRINEIINIRNKLAVVYQSNLQNPDFILPSVPKEFVHTWQTYHILVQSKNKRNEYLNLFRERGIGSNYGAQCIPSQIYYKRKYSIDAEKEFPNAFNAYTNGIAVPLYETLNEEKINYIIDTLNSIKL